MGHSYEEIRTVAIELLSGHENPNYSLKKQITVIIRIAFGCAIITLHIIQFIHK